MNFILPQNNLMVCMAKTFKFNMLLMSNYEGQMTINNNKQFSVDLRLYKRKLHTGRCMQAFINLNIFCHTYANICVASPQFYKCLGEQVNYTVC